MFIAVTSALVSQIAQARLSGTTLAVYLYLRSLNPFGNRVIKSQQKDIAAALNISESSVSRALQKLKNKDLLCGLAEVVVTQKRYSEFGFHCETQNCKVQNVISESQPLLSESQPPLADSQPLVAQPATRLQNCNFDHPKPAHSAAFEDCRSILDINIENKKEDLRSETSFFSEDDFEFEPQEDDLSDLPIVKVEPCEASPAKIPPENITHPIDRFEQQFSRHPWQIPGGAWDDIDPGFVEFRRKALQATPAYKNRDCTTADAIVSILRLQTARVGISKQELATNLATLKQYWNLYKLQTQANTPHPQASAFESIPDSVHRARVRELDHINIIEFDRKYSFEYRSFLIQAGYFNAA
jgi:hypothetical protein